MIVSFTKQADLDIDFFKRSGNKQIVKKIKELLQSIIDDPYKGIGQPEPLKHDLQVLGRGELIRNIAWCMKSKVKLYISFP